MWALPLHWAPTGIEQSSVYIITYQQIHIRHSHNINIIRNILTFLGHCVTLDHIPETYKYRNKQKSRRHLAYKHSSGIARRRTVVRKTYKHSSGTTRHRTLVWNILTYIYGPTLMPSTRSYRRKTHLKCRMIAETSLSRNQL